MKYPIYLFVLLLVFLTYGRLFGQSTPDLKFDTIFPRSENGIEYIKVFDVDSLEKREIILRVKEWAMNSFNSQKGALQSEDLETGYLLYQGFGTNTYTIPKGWGFSLIGSQIYTITYETKFSINFYIKDYKFKVIINKIINTPVSAYGVWYDVLNSTVENRKLDYPSVPIEKAGQEAIAEYYKHPKDKKYLVRLNFQANKWRDINNSMYGLIDSINKSIAAKKKSAFDF